MDLGGVLEVTKFKVYEHFLYDSNSNEMYNLVDKCSYGSPNLS